MPALAKGERVRPVREHVKCSRKDIRPNPTPALFVARFASNREEGLLAAGDLSVVAEVDHHLAVSIAPVAPRIRREIRVRVEGWAAHRDQHAVARHADLGQAALDAVLVDLAEFLDPGLVAGLPEIQRLDGLL